MDDIIKKLIENHPVFSKYDNHTENSMSNYEWEKCNSDYEFLGKLNTSLFFVMTHKGYSDQEAHEHVLKFNIISSKKKEKESD